MERATTSGKCNTIHKNRGLDARSRARSRARVTAAVPVPANGLNRAISVKEGKAFSKALDESKTGHKSLRSRICDLWLVRKIIGLFKRLLTCSRKVVVSASEDAGKLMKIGDCATLADRLLRKVQVLVGTIEKKDPPLDQWTEARLNLEEFSTELTRLEKNISAFMSRQSDHEEKALRYLVTQKRNIEIRISWIKFYFASNKKDNYRKLNTDYFINRLDRLCTAAKRAIKHAKNMKLIDKLMNSYSTAVQDITKKADEGQISAALVRVEAFRSTCNIILDAGLLD